MKKVLQRFTAVTDQYPVFFFLLTLLFYFAWLGFPEMLFRLPRSLHFIRQTDSLSFVADYYNHGLHFFQPGTFSLNSTSGRAACEFPITYYVTALLYHLTGPHFSILRFINLAIATTGFVYVFRTIRFFLKDTFTAWALTLIIVSSPILLYYSNNFLPDAAALGLTLCGWFHAARYIQSCERKSLLFASLLFLFASLIKVTHLINPVALFCTLVTLTIKSENRSRRDLHFPFLITACLIAIVAGWNVYVVQYNLYYHDSYFLTSATPIWSLGSEEIQSIRTYLSVWWLNSYLYRSSLHVLMIATLFLLLPIKLIDLPVRHAARWLMAGSLIFLLLFFAKLKDHDYYFMTVTPAVVFILTGGMLAVKNRFGVFFNGMIFRSGLLVLLIASLLHGKSVLEHRYTELDQPARNEYFRKLMGLRRELPSLGVTDGSKFIVFGDATPNASLLALNQSGWSMDDTLVRGKRVSYLQRMYEGADFAVFKEATAPVSSRYASIVLSKDSVHVMKLDRNSLTKRVNEWTAYITQQPDWDAKVRAAAVSNHTSYEEALLGAALIMVENE